MVDCPTCSGTDPECGDCDGHGEVTRSRRATLSRVRPTLPHRPSKPPEAKKPVVESHDGVDVWPRSAVPKILPWVSYPQVDRWARTGLWVPQFPAAGGSGNRAVVAIGDLEGLGLIGRLATFLTHAVLPPWAEIRRTCQEGGVWMAADGVWGSWQPGVDLVPMLGVVVDVGAVVDEVRVRAAAAR